MTGPTLHPSPTPVVLLAGPSGSGKSTLARRAGLPVLSLDDFYRAGDDPGLPRTRTGAVDWDSPASWDAEGALAAVLDLCRTGSCEVPVYDIAADRAVGTRTVALDRAPAFVAEGIFAAEVAPGARAAGLLADAVCLRHPPLVTFWRRLLRDLSEHRKPPRVLLARGLRLLVAERSVVARQAALGAVPCGRAEALTRVRSAVRREAGSGSRRVPDRAAAR